MSYVLNDIVRLLQYVFFRKNIFKMLLIKSIFSFSICIEDQVFLLTCDWNYRNTHCTDISQTCQTAESEGVSIIHAQGGAFLKADR